MNQPLTHKDIDGKYHKKLFVQDYTKQPVIEGVQVVELRNMIGEDGDFSELLRFDETGQAEQFPGFFVRQINKSLLTPGSVKAWHLHYNQEDIWHVLPADTLLIGLWDVRHDSPTKNMTMKLALGRGKAHLVYIPRGVAHGLTNLSNRNATMLYFVNQQFAIENPDEHRLPWDSLPNFWEVTKG